MDILKSLSCALWQHDYTTLTDPSLIWALYILLFVVLFLENGLLPTSFLPGDSLLVLVGVLIAKGIINGILTLIILTLAAGLGCWVSYIQGKWLGNTFIIKKWLSYLPAHYHQKVNYLFHKYGLSALFISRFIAFVRTLLPTIAGLSSLNSIQFQFFNWTSAFLWVLVLLLAGFLLGNTAIFYYYESQFMLFLIVLPLGLMLFSAMGIAYILWRHNISENKNNHL
ncbi:Inner membrane protein YqjA [Candidatus Erwinia haradaeae]|uniref:Inner membrane protein YqjA n=1 Tax=Candidatus Erwinia haradaeae TaxID=1922217 RepID=A0A451DCF8_9GAMM|nr:DedA family protein [Candidatus Erwinia haradaeae]VFP84065.1 Inner membrane protein YqjA [Candidatus Erwinia haradaeae]